MKILNPDVVSLFDIFFNSLVIDFFKSVRQELIDSIFGQFQRDLSRIRSINTARGRLWREEHSHGLSHK